MLGNRLKDLRYQKEITQEELGKVLNKTKNNISQYETGKRQPDNETLIKISEYFQVSLDYLLGKTDIKNFTSDDELKKLIMQSNINDTDNDIRNSLMSMKEKLSNSNEIFVDGTTLSDSHKNMLLSAINVILESYVNK
ncbi:helix-turn-helix domain-containing protein [Clostridium sp.]|uniref:helix-turn-helix domain-containing protein n=1 Tax=Clostridium sp. TaxID=1506 RepID=UPI002902A0A5|nr:helix-turn-helix domain-containing protein [Clostridium sp.]MDU2282267.1 helix-turn-helix domain-containing protein [Clostridium sp.]